MIRSLTPAYGCQLTWKGRCAGDIGTSPLYVIQSTFNIGGTDPSEEDIIGVISLIIWTLTALLVFK